MSVDEKKNIRLSSLCESLTDVPVCVCVCSHKAEEANVCIAGKKLREGAGQRVWGHRDDDSTWFSCGFWKELAGHPWGMEWGCGAVFMNTKKHWENRVEAALTPMQYTARDLSDELGPNY